MENIYYVLFVCLILWYFIYLRKVSEFALLHTKKYCENEGIQFISLARKSSRFKFNTKLGPHWISNFEFEFSGNGESSYIGEVTLKGYKLEKFELPPYKIN